MALPDGRPPRADWLQDVISVEPNQGPGSVDDAGVVLDGTGPRPARQTDLSSRFGLERDESQRDGLSRGGVNRGALIGPG